MNNISNVSSESISEDTQAYSSAVVPHNSRTADTINAPGPAVGSANSVTAGGNATGGSANSVATGGNATSGSSSSVASGGNNSFTYEFGCGQNKAININVTDAFNAPGGEGGSSSSVASGGNASGASASSFASGGDHSFTYENVGGVQDKAIYAALGAIGGSVLTLAGGALYRRRKEGVNNAPGAHFG